MEPSLHFDYKHSLIKQHCKLGRALRTETTVNDTGDFAVGRLLRSIERLPRTHRYRVTSKGRRIAM